MIDHLSITTTDLDRTQTLYRASVRVFHEAAIRHGGVDDGPPGLRPEYHHDYYGAFVRDPDGNRIEAVTHVDEDTQ